MAYLYTLNLGSTNKFFMPWLVPRNDASSVYQQNILGKLFNGRRRREVTFQDSTVLKSKWPNEFISGFSHVLRHFDFIITNSLSPGFPFSPRELN